MRVGAASTVLGPVPLATSLPSAGTIVGSLAVALVAIAVLAWLMRRYAQALPLLAIVALPFRLPISADGRTVNLLIPIYLVVAAGTLVRLLPALLARLRLAQRPGAGAGAGEVPRRGAVAAVPGADDRTPRELAFWASPRGLTWLLFGAVCLYALQVAYSADRVKALENVAFFYVPFALLFALLAQVRWTRELLMRCLVALVSLAVVFAGVGFVEYDRKSLFLNPKVVAADQYDNYFRVNSVFFDPSIYGRFLALVMIALCTLVLWNRNRRVVIVGAVALAWLLAGLVTSFSQSSIAALLVGLAVLAAWRWSVIWTVYVSAAVLALGALVLLLAPASLHFGLKGSSGSTNNATSGRTSLVSGGLELFAKRPLEGYGPGSYETEYKRHSHADAQSATSASHTIPVTIAAEQGILGLAVYAALLLSAFIVLFRGAGRSPPRMAIAACFAALVLHTWTYADFLEDPFTWTLLAIGVALARAPASSF
ncbi:MAG TPA: O-antigen ligase family protein [Solirubrobacteraceae bacterium]|nr:O-antigen ligase family protein [Solirubrobacteraceae bacterium]